eukprot:1156363-Pelagomonas_calceolata.AAC.3
MSRVMHALFAVGTAVECHPQMAGQGGAGKCGLHGLRSKGQVSSQPEVRIQKAYVPVCRNACKS